MISIRPGWYLRHLMISWGWAHSLWKLSTLFGWMMRGLRLHTLTHHLVLGQSLTHVTTHLILLTVFKGLSSGHVLRGLMFQVLLAVYEAFSLSGAHRLCYASLYFFRQKATLSVISGIIIRFNLALTVEGASRCWNILFIHASKGRSKLSLRWRAILIHLVLGLSGCCRGLLDCFYTNWREFVAWGWIESNFLNSIAIAWTVLIRDLGLVFK